MNPIIGSVAILGGVGFVFAVLITLAHRKLRVWEDPRIDAVAGMLPGANCGACGQPGCRGFAEKAVAGEVQPATCNVLNDDGVAAIAAFLGVDAGQSNRRVARVLCAGGTDVTARRAEYRGLTTCGASATVAGGGHACVWGCLGFGDCATACTFGAITMNDRGLPAVDIALCTACGDCETACPKNLFTMIPLDQRLLVQCRSLMEGDEALAACSVACTSCGKCVLDAAPGLISIESGVAVVDYAANAQADRAAIRRCPTSAIVWVEGAQFASAAAAGALAGSVAS